MSIQAMTWAMNLPNDVLPSPTDNHVLLVLCNYANDRNIAYPSVRTLARVTKLSERAVQLSLRRLEKTCAIRPASAQNIERKYRSDRMPTAYRINRPRNAESRLTGTSP
jgi:pyocin large subunit-like protein